MFFLVRLNVGMLSYKYTTSPISYEHIDGTYVSGPLYDIDIVERNNALEQQDFSLELQDDTLQQELLLNPLDKTSTFKMWYISDNIDNGNPQLFYTGYLKGFNIKRKVISFDISTNYNILDFTYGLTLNKNNVSSGNNLFDQLSNIDAELSAQEDTRDELQKFITEYKIKTPQWYQVDKWFSGSKGNKGLTRKQKELDLVNTRITNLSTIKKMQDAKMPLYYGSVWAECYPIGKLTLYPYADYYIDRYYYIISTKELDLYTYDICVGNTVYSNINGVSKEDEDYNGTHSNSTYIHNNSNQFSINTKINETYEYGLLFGGTVYTLNGLATEDITINGEDYTVVSLYDRVDSRDINNSAFKNKFPSLKMRIKAQPQYTNEILLDYLTQVLGNTDSIDVDSFSQQSENTVNIVLDSDSTVAENIQILCKEDNSYVYFKNGKYSYRRLTDSETVVSSFNEDNFISEPVYSFDYSKRLKEVNVKYSQFDEASGKYVEVTDTVSVDSNYTETKDLEIATVGHDQAYRDKFVSTWVDLYNNSKKLTFDIHLKDGYNLGVNDVIEISYDELGFIDKKFYIDNVSIDLLEETVSVTALEYDPLYFNNRFDLLDIDTSYDTTIYNVPTPNFVSWEKQSELIDGVYRSPILFTWEHDYIHGVEYEITVNNTTYRTTSKSIKIYDLPYGEHTATLKAIGTSYYSSTSGVDTLNFTHEKITIINPITNPTHSFSNGVIYFSWDRNTDDNFLKYEIELNGRTYTSFENNLSISDVDVGTYDINMYAVSVTNFRSTVTPYTLTVSQPTLMFSIRDSYLMEKAFLDGEITIYVGIDTPTNQNTFDIWRQSGDSIQLNHFTFNDSILSGVTFNADSIVFYKYWNGSDWVFCTQEQVSVIQRMLGQVTETAINDGEVRIFNTLPYTPYSIGDLWLDGATLKKSNTDRATGNFNSGDWVVNTVQETGVFTKLENVILSS